jgi:hypothetical protein
MRKLSLVLAVVMACLSCFAASAGAKSAPTKLTIQSSPGGAFGYVSSPDTKTCAANRKVVVFEQVGAERDPASDPRVAADRAGESEAKYVWTVQAGRSGNFYAQAAAKPGCGAALSGTVQSLTVAQGIGKDPTDYPPCGPYVSQGPTEICRFNAMFLELEFPEHQECSWGAASNSCPGEATVGLFPWAVAAIGGGTTVKLSWFPSGGKREVTVDSYSNGTFAAQLGGSVPFAGSPRFTVTNGFAANGFGNPNGDRFFTPNLPGQAQGEVGGPLAINVQSLSTGGASAWISGYLYLRH